MWLQAGVLPYSEAINAISGTIVALCLNMGGLARVKESRVMDAYVPIFTNPKCVRRSVICHDDT